MESQKGPQQEQPLSQESLLPLEEEQLQDVTGGKGGWGEKLLSCLICGSGSFKQQPAYSLIRSNSSSHNTAANPPHNTPANSPDNSPSGSPIHGVVSPILGVTRSGSLSGGLTRSASA